MMELKDLLCFQEVVDFKELKGRHINKLTILDDTHVGVKNWIDFADLFNEYPGVEELKVKYIGPGKSLLDKLETSEPSLTLRQFIKVAKKLERNDICQLLST